MGIPVQALEGMQNFLPILISFYIILLGSSDGHFYPPPLVPFWPGYSNIQYNTGYGDDNIRQTSTGSAQECAFECTQTPNCVAWSRYQGNGQHYCGLKATANYLRGGVTYDSGLILRQAVYPQYNYFG